MSAFQRIFCRSAAFLAAAAALILPHPYPAWALRVSQEGAGLEELRRALLPSGELRAGLETLSPTFLAYERDLARRINEKGVFRVELGKEGHLRKLILKNKILYGSGAYLSPSLPSWTLGESGPEILLAYATDSGLLLLNTRLQVLRYVSPRGESFLIERSLGETPTMDDRAEAARQFQILMQLLAEAGGAVRIQIPSQERGKKRADAEPKRPASSLVHQLSIELANRQGTVAVFLTKHNRWVVSHRALASPADEQFAAARELFYRGRLEGKSFEPNRKEALVKILALLEFLTLEDGETEFGHWGDAGWILQVWISAHAPQDAGNLPREHLEFLRQVMSTLQSKNPDFKSGEEDVSFNRNELRRLIEAYREREGRSLSMILRERWFGAPDDERKPPAGLEELLANLEEAGADTVGDRAERESASSWLNRLP